MKGIILAKEKSQRLSLNKAFIEIKGEFLIERIIKIIKPYCKDILIISDDQRLSQFGKRFEDIFKGKGPISGLYTGLYYSDCERNLVLASDLPFLESPLIEYIIGNSKWEIRNAECKNVNGNFQAIIPVIDGKKEPFCAIYLKEALPLIKEQIENNELSLQGLIKRLNVKYVNCNKFRNCFFNLNREEDLVKCLRWGL
ncbi:MAG: molybdenum cofactor guanylyltransferase [bacterium]